MTPRKNEQIMYSNQTPEPVTTPEGYLTKKEIAKRCCRTSRTIEVWMQRGYLPFIKLGRSVLFKWADVERHLADNHRVLRRGRAGIVHRSRLSQPSAANSH